MGNNTNNRIYGAVAADVLTNANNIIQGSGQIGADQMGFVNQSAGVVDANVSNNLTIWTSNGTTNQGTLEATAGGNLILKNDTFTNTGGTILASGTNSVVTLLNPTIVRRHAEHGQRRPDSSFRQPHAERGYQQGHLSVAQR